MMNLARWRNVLAVAACTALFAACGGSDDPSPTRAEPPPATGGEPTTPPVVSTPSEVSNELTRMSLTAAAGGKLSVPTGAAALAKTEVTIPPDAALEDIEVHLGYQDAAPGAFRAEAAAAGATAVSKAIQLKVAKGARHTFNQLVTVTMPYDTAAAGGLPPAVVYWDEAALAYRPVAVTAVDRTNGLVTFKTSHFSTFLAVIVKNLGIAIPDVATGFQLGVDSILHQNFGSYQYGGHCAAFASMSSHYFSLHKTKPLYTLAQEGAVEQPVDDELTRSALTMTYALVTQKWASFAADIVVPSAPDTGLLVLASMIVTGDPVHLVLHSNNATDGGHSVTVYGYDATAKTFSIYDSNFPKDPVTFAWNLTDGFGAYSKAAAYKATLFSHIGYASDDTFGAPAQFQKIIADWESGALKDYYANLSITDDKGATQALAFGSSVTTTIPYEDGKSVAGHYQLPGGGGKPVYLHVYLDGVKQAAVAPAIDASGNFSIVFPTKLEQKVEVTMIVSQDPRDIGTGFSAFGRFSVQAEGKNFFVNFGFETGDLTGWTAQTTRSLAIFTPTKTTIVGIGFDPIATDLPTTVIGQHALMVNDSTNDLHVTYVSQTAKVPTSGNPQLRFQWAAVLEDPQHSPADQPYVDVTVRNDTKGIDIYKRRYYTNDPTFPGWKDYRGGNWKAIPWQSVVLGGLSQYAGDDITLTMVGADCALGAHGGYVYLDGEE